jgi:two-component system LytT family response regulator
MQLDVIIIDDEPLALAGLRDLLAQDPEIGHIQEARNGREAVETILAAKPDLAFLDIQMPEIDGFSVVRAVGPERMPEVVFVTAHDKYAVSAFEINAVDYLLKPVTAERFAQSLTRAKARIASKSAETNRRVAALLETIAVAGRFPKRLAAESRGTTALVDVNDIDWIEGTENYVTLHAGKACYLMHVTMKTLADRLDPGTFLRIHRSLIVNLDRVKELRPADHGEFFLTLENGVTLRSGRTYREKLRELSSYPL